MVTLDTVETFSPDTTLPLLITASAPADSVVLGMGSANTEQQAFPKYTKYSLDNGESYYMLYEPGLIHLPVTAGTPLGVVLDLSDTAISAEADLELAAYAYETTTLLGAGYGISTPALTQTVTADVRILTEDMVLTVTAQEPWGAYPMHFEAELMTVQTVEENESVSFAPFPFGEEGLIAELTQTETGSQQLALRLGQTLPPAGTYRLKLCWEYQGIYFGHTEVFLFVNYTQTITDQTGGAEQ